MKGKQQEYQMVHIASGLPSQRVGQDEMDKLYRMSTHRGGRSFASVMREAIAYLYEKEEKSMEQKTKTLKYSKTK